LSRDPLEGNAHDPETLHKYLYAGGDPVNAIDPMGREVLVEYIVQLPTRIFVYTQIYVPMQYGAIQFYGVAGALFASVIAAH
jgi:hypothetical protein